MSEEEKLHSPTDHSSLSPRFHKEPVSDSGNVESLNCQRISTPQVFRKMSADPFVRTISPPRTGTRSGTAGGGFHLHQPSMYDTLNHLPPVSQSSNKQEFPTNIPKEAPITPRFGSRFFQSPPQLPTPPKTSISVSFHPTNHESSSAISESPRIAQDMKSTVPPDGQAAIRAATQRPAGSDLGLTDPPPSSPREIFKRGCLVPGYSDRLEAEVRALIRFEHAAKPFSV